MRVFVIRHGESEDDLSDSYGGAANFRLTDLGRRQAGQVVERVSGAGISKIFTSPLLRASESAAILAEGLGGVPVETVFDLRERNTYGVLSGHTPARAKELFGYLLDTLDFEPGKGQQCVPGGEEYAPFIDRVRRAFQYVVESSTADSRETIAIVTHGKFTLGLFTEVLRLGSEYDKDHASVNVIEYMPARLSS